MTPVLDGVRIGPLDPDRGENFGQVGGQSTARQLIRHHVAMHPPALVAALSRVRQDERSDAIDKAEAEEYVRKLYDDAGEPIPEDSKITGLAVRGADEQPESQVVTFTFTTKGGRSAKGFVPYGELSNSVEAGDEAVRIAKLKEAGLPWTPLEATRQAAGIRGTGVEEGEFDASAENDELRSENEALRGELDELRERLSAVEGQQPTPETAGGGSGVQSSPQTPEGGSPATEGTRTAVAPEEPWEGYDEAKAQDIRARLRESSDPQLAQAVLDYESREGGASRGTVTSAANEVLDRNASGE